MKNVVSLVFISLKGHQSVRLMKPIPHSLPCSTADRKPAGLQYAISGVIRCHKDVGLVNDVFDEKTLESMSGNMAIGHVRYSTTGQPSRENAQPLASPM